MPRPKRVIIDNVTYHTRSRCLKKLPLLGSERLKELFLDIIAKSQNKYLYDLVFYEILDDHFHLIIKTRHGGASISRIMQYIKARIAERYNKMMKTFGPLWNERFKDDIIEMHQNPSQHFMHLIWHLAYNAVRSDLVNDPRKYKYGAINHYLVDGFNAKVKVHLHEYFYGLGLTFHEGQSIDLL